MNDNYLWDRSGETDPEIERLESLLGQLRYRRPPLELPAARPAVAPAGGAAWRRRAVPLALAAAIALMVVGTWVSRPEPGGERPVSAAGPAGAWIVAPLEGTPTLARQPLEREAAVPADRWLETDATSTARLSAPDVGRVDIGPRSLVRIVTTTPGNHRLALLRGRLDAFIWASPGQFFVETPSATAIDLGCSYSLEIDEHGDGWLRVTAGWVGFELDGRESLVPQGAVCATRPGRGPGTPHFEDANASFKEALAKIDDGRGAPGALERLLREARSRDALSLWHLLSRLDAPAVGQVYDRLAVVAPPPPGVLKERVLAGDRGALDAWWDSLGFGEAAQFRAWMR